MVSANPCLCFENSSDLLIHFWSDFGSYFYHFAVNHYGHGCFLEYFAIASENQSVVISNAGVVNVHARQLAIGLYPARRNESSKDLGNAVEMALADL